MLAARWLPSANRHIVTAEKRSFEKLLDVNIIQLWWLICVLEGILESSPSFLEWAELCPSIGLSRNLLAERSSGGSLT